ncbi:MAG: hypothetical protein CL946_10570 [Ectothiorhodospiraceae bacterium]|nr:hypothetical protein [Ectothiorhodospiraceae bacterium]
MLESLFGNQTVEKILFYLSIHGTGYANKIAVDLGMPVNAVQQQFQRLEKGGIVVCEYQGRTRNYTFNPDFALLTELQKLLSSGLRQMEQTELAHYYRGTQEEAEWAPSVRAVIIQDGYLLVATNGTTDTFLPGGAFLPELGAEGSLRKHLADQFQARIRVTEKLGFIEQKQPMQESRYDMDIVLRAELQNFQYPDRPKGLGVRLDFYWHPIAKIDQMHLVPEGMTELVLKAA